MHADSEHQQDDTDLSSLRGQLGVGYKPRRKRSICYASQKIPDEWRQAQPAGDVAANQSIDQADSNRRNQRDFMMHGKSCDKIYFRSFHPDVRLNFKLQHILQLGNSSSAHRSQSRIGILPVERLAAPLIQTGSLCYNWRQQGSMGPEHPRAYAMDLSLTMEAS